MNESQKTYSDGTEHFEDALDVKAVNLSIDKKIEQSLVDSILEPSSVIPDAAELPTSLPTTWTRVVTSVPILDSDLFIVRIQGVKQEMMQGEGEGEAGGEAADE